MDRSLREVHEGKRYRGGYNAYGRGLGIMLLDTTFPRIVGDVGNARTYDYPILFEIVEGADSARVIREQDPELLDPFVEAAENLIDKGAVAITTSCGFLLMFQDELTERIDDVPIFTSSLLQIPVVRAMTPPDQKIGIIAADENDFEKLDHRFITENEEQLVVHGMAESDPFRELVFTEERDLDYDEINEEVVDVVKKLAEREPDIGALILEDANLHPYIPAIQDELNVPVFDFLTLSNMVWWGCYGTRF